MQEGAGPLELGLQCDVQPGKNAGKVPGSAALDSGERVVTRLCVLGMPLTRSPAQSACRMVLRLPLLWTSAHTDVRVLLRALRMCCEHPRL